MVFTASHTYWTFHWSVTGSADEQGQIGIRASAPGTPPTLSTVEDVSDAFQTFWVAANSYIHNSFRYFRIKAATILPSGLYDPEFDPVIIDVSSVGGGVSNAAGNAYPLQVAHSVQLATDRDSGPAHAGRVFLPPIAATIGTDFLASSSAVTARVGTFATFLTAMNAAIGAESVQVMSFKGAGTTRTVTGVRADNRLDVQRRRARQQTGTWSSTAAVTP